MMKKAGDVVGYYKIYYFLTNISFKSYMNCISVK